MYFRFLTNASPLAKTAPHNPAFLVLHQLFQNNHFENDYYQISPVYLLISKEFANFSSKISNLNANKIENAHFCHKLKIVMKFDYYRIKYDYFP